jgi:hypothetical protein
VHLGEYCLIKELLQYWEINGVQVTSDIIAIVAGVNSWSNMHLVDSHGTLTRDEF